MRVMNRLDVCAQSLISPTRVLHTDTPCVCCNAPFVCAVCAVSPPCALTPLVCAVCARRRRPVLGPRVALPGHGNSNNSAACVAVVYV